MSTPQDVKARFLADHQALHPHPERVRDTLFQQGDFFDPRFAPGPLRDAASSLGRAAAGDRNHPGLWGQSADVLRVAEDVPERGIGRIVASQTRPEGCPQVYRSGRRFRCRTPGGIARPIEQGVGRGGWRQVRCPVAPADPGAASVAAGKKTPRQDAPLLSITGPSELVARYESIRPAAGSGPALSSYESAMLLHQGVPGWLAFVRRQAEGCRPVSAWVEAEGSFFFQVMSTASMPRRPEVVCVLASVVSHCLGGVA